MGYCDQNLQRNRTVWKVAKNHTIQFVSNCKYICCKWQSSLVNSLSSHFFLIFLQLTITYQASKGFCGKATVLQYYLFIIFNSTSKMALAWSERIEGNLLLCFSALWLLTLKQEECTGDSFSEALILASINPKCNIKLY